MRDRALGKAKRIVFVLAVATGIGFAFFMKSCVEFIQPGWLQYT